jgi:hypothetical protein
LGCDLRFSFRLIIQYRYTFAGIHSLRQVNRNITDALYLIPYDAAIVRRCADFTIHAYVNLSQFPQGVGYRYFLDIPAFGLEHKDAGSVYAYLQSISQPHFAALIKNSLKDM